MSSNDDSTLNNNNNNIINKEDEESRDRPNHTEDLNLLKRPDSEPHINNLIKNSLANSLSLNRMTTLDSLPPSLVANLAAITAFQQSQKHHHPNLSNLPNLSNISQQQQFYHQQLQQLQHHQLLQQSQLASAQHLATAQNLSAAANLRKEPLGSPKQPPTSTPSRSPASTPTPAPMGGDVPLDLSAKPSNDDAGSVTSRSSSPTIEQRLQSLVGARHPLAKLGLVDTATLLQDPHLYK